MEINGGHAFVIPVHDFDQISGFVVPLTGIVFHLAADDVVGADVKSTTAAAAEEFESIVFLLRVAKQDHAALADVAEGLGRFSS